MKRQLAYFVVIFIGFLALAGHFINYPPLNNFIDNDATQWFDIISGFAAFLGVVNLLQLHFKKLAYKKKNWKYSVLTIIGFTLMIIFGFFYKGLNGDPYDDRNNNGKYDYAEDFTDLNSNNIWDSNEKFIDLGNGKYDMGEEFIDLGNGKYDIGEDFNDINANKEYDEVETYIDLGNGIYDYKGNETYIDLGNGIYDYEEEYTDLIGNYKYDLGEEFIDSNNNGEWNYPESFTDMPDELYTKEVKWGAHLKNEKSAFYWMFDNVYLPLGATMFALLAFFVASASYRAFKIRNFEATLLLISGVLLMIGRVPIGHIIPWWMSVEIYICIIFALTANKFSNRKNMILSFILCLVIIPLIVYFLNITHWNLFKIPEVQEWIFDVPATAGSRAIMIGIALGTIAQSFRIITGREKSILGD